MYIENIRWNIEVKEPVQSRCKTKFFNLEIDCEVT